METVVDTIWQYLLSSGFGQFHWSNGVMLLVGGGFIYLAVRKGFEPLLLVPIGFGILIGNIPYDASRLPLSVYDGPVAQHDLAYYRISIDRIEIGSKVQSLDQTLKDLAISRLDHESLMQLIYQSDRIRLNSVEHIESSVEALRLLELGQAVMVNTHSLFPARQSMAQEDAPAIVAYGQGRYLLVAGTQPSEQEAQVGVDHGQDSRYPELWSFDKQDPFNASIFWWLFAGVGVAGFYPPLIFLGIGALTDFGPMLSNPKTLFLGAAAQFGIFGSLLGALYLGFDLNEAASIGIIGGADGPTAIFTSSRLAPELLGPVALAAYSYMALVPIIQPPIIRLLTTRRERLIRMEYSRPVSKTVKVLFPIVGFLLTAAFAPGGLPLLGMLFFGNLLRESMVTERLAKTAQTSFIDIVTILLGVTVGAKTAAANFLTIQTLQIFLLGIIAFAIATATGVLFGRLMSWLSTKPLNPMIGAAGVSAVPMSARVVHKLGLEEDPQNFLLMHAMGPNVAGVIGSAVAAGVLLSRLSGYG